MGELKRHYGKRGPSAAQKQWKEIQQTFDIAKQCVKEYEMEQERLEGMRLAEEDRQWEAVHLVEWIRDGGKPY